VRHFLLKIYSSNIFVITTWISRICDPPYVVDSLVSVYVFISGIGYFDYKRESNSPSIFKRISHRTQLVINMASFSRVILVLGFMMVSITAQIYFMHSVFESVSLIETKFYFVCAFCFSFRAWEVPKLLTTVVRAKITQCACSRYDKQWNCMYFNYS